MPTEADTCRVLIAPELQAADFTLLPPAARGILNDLLDKYPTDGEIQFTLFDVLKVPAISATETVAQASSPASSGSVPLPESHRSGRPDNTQPQRLRSPNAAEISGKFGEQTNPATL